MRLVKPSIEFLWMTLYPLQTIEAAGRTCYKSEGRITMESAEAFVKKLLERGHHAMIEHARASYRVVCDRGVTHEIVRHRLFSYAQESTRYCNYKGGVTFIIPPWVNNVALGEMKLIPHSELGEIIESADDAWLWHLQHAENTYCGMLKEGWSPQQARSVLPNSLKTEIVITGNLREWMHFFSLRCTPSGIPEEKLRDGIYYGAGAPHPQMQEVANILLEDIRARIPVLFEQEVI